MDAPTQVLRLTALAARMPIIYRKSAKGVTEIETRAHRLLPRARSTLILVDGKRDADQLRGLIQQQADETLAMLLEQGFIELMPEPIAAPASAAAPAPAVSAPGAEFATRRRAAVRDLNDALGPAGETLAIRMERAANDTELRSMVQTAAQLIAGARGGAAADAYAARHAG